MALRPPRLARCLPPALALCLGLLVSPGRAQTQPRPPVPRPVGASQSLAKPSAVPASLDPSDVYFQAWLLVRDADKLQQKADFAGALDKYRRARQLFDSVIQSCPDWKPDMVKGRLDATSEAIAAVEPKAREQNKKSDQAVAEIEGTVIKGHPGQVIIPSGFQPLDTKAAARQPTPNKPAAADPSAWQQPRRRTAPATRPTPTTTAPTRG